jgi:hypothetical protein
MIFVRFSMIFIHLKTITAEIMSPLILLQVDSIKLDVDGIGGCQSGQVVMPAILLIKDETLCLFNVVIGSLVCLR